MQPHKPSHRHLLGGLLTSLFGWLLPRKAPAQSPLPQPAAAEALRVETMPYSSTVVTYFYDANGDCIAVSPPLTYHGTAFTTYDAQNRISSLSNSSPPPSQEPANG